MPAKEIPVSNNPSMPDTLIPAFRETRNPGSGHRVVEVYRKPDGWTAMVEAWDGDLVGRGSSSGNETEQEARVYATEDAWRDMAARLEGSFDEGETWDGTTTAATMLSLEELAAWQDKILRVTAQAEPEPEYGWPRKGDVVRTLSGNLWFAGSDMSETNVVTGNYPWVRPALSDPQWAAERDGRDGQRFRRLTPPAAEPVATLRKVAPGERPSEDLFLQRVPSLEQTEQLEAQREPKRSLAEGRNVAAWARMREVGRRAAATHSAKPAASKPTCPHCNGTRLRPGFLGGLSQPCNDPEYHQ